MAKRNVRGSRVAVPRQAQARTQAALPSEQQQEKRPPFLKAADIGSGAKLKLIPGSVRTLNGQFGQQLVVDVDLHGSIYSWGVNINSPNLRLLVEALVEDSKTPVRVSTLISQNNRPYIAILQDHQAPTRGRGRSAPPADDDDVPF
jgi:hypothetical protein